MSVDPFKDADFFEGATFDALDLTGARVAGKEFFRCSFHKLKWTDARLENCSFERCTFDDSDFTQLKPKRTGFHGVEMKLCKLVGADFSGLNENPEVTFSECAMRFFAATDLNLRETSFSDCELRESSFASCSLVDADFVRCDLAGATFERCELGGADFSTSSNVFLDPRRNTTKGAFVPVESAVLLAHANGMIVAGYDAAPKRKKARRSATR